MTWFVVAALVPTASAQALETSGLQGCEVANAIIPIFPSEVSHVYGVRLAVGGISRFEVDNLVYSLVDQLGIPLCNGARSHRLDVWVQNTDFPDATPVLQFSTVLTQTPTPGAPNDFYVVDIPNFIVAPNEQVFVGFEMTADAQDDALCVLTCGQGTAVPMGGEHFWSNAATTPYNWSDVVTDFGILSTPFIQINGQRLLIDPTASLGRGVSLGANVVVGVGAVVRDRSDIGDGAVILAHARVGHDAIIGAGATLGEGSVVRDRADVGNQVTLGQGVVVGHDATIGAGTTVGDLTTLRDRTQVGDNVQIGSNVTLGHDVVVGDGAQIGDGAILRDRVVVAAGTVIPDNAVVR
ncbi:MAG: DapH/DapD/GlmU-related protein [Myxococcota bacterium]